MIDGIDRREKSTAETKPTTTEKVGFWISEQELLSSTRQQPTLPRSKLEAQVRSTTKRSSEGR